MHSARSFAFVLAALGAAASIGGVFALTTVCTLGALPIAGLLP